jgi:Ca-activated chloride channel homolog
MTVRITSMTDAEASRVATADDDAGLGALRTERGNLPLDRIDVRAEITGLTSRVELTQDFVNTLTHPSKRPTCSHCRIGVRSHGCK